MTGCTYCAGYPIQAMTWPVRRYAPSCGEPSVGPFNPETTQKGFVPSGPFNPESTQKFPPGALDTQKMPAADPTSTQRLPTDTQKLPAPSDRTKTIKLPEK